MPKDKDNFKFYTVTKGRIPGIYNNWALAEKQVNGFRGSVYKGHKTSKAAEKFVLAADIGYPKYFITQPEDASELSVSALSEWSPLSDDEDKHTLEVEGNASNSTPLKTSSNSTSINNCSGCALLEKTINHLISRLDEFDKILLTSANDSVMSPVIDEKLDNLAARLSNVEQQLKQSYSRIVSKPAPAMSTGTNLQPPTAKPPHSVPHNTPNAHKQSTNAVTNNSAKFCPEKCIVLSASGTDHAPLKSLPHDTIRRTLSTNHGPLIIDSISKYHFNSTNPRLMIQLSSKETVEKVVTDWRPDSFGGTTVRATIKPSSNTLHGMVKGVPLDITDHDIMTAVNHQYPDSTHARLSKNDQPLRTIKITFADAEQKNKAIAEGLLLDTYNMLFRVEPPYQTTSNNGY